MQAFFRDLRYALRVLFKSWSFAVISILTLALGIGANTAIFSLMNPLVFRPLNVPEPDRLVRMFCNRAGGDNMMSYPNYVDLRRRAQSYTNLAAYSSPTPISLGLGAGAGAGTSARIWGSVVSGNYFDTLGVAAARGRTFTADEDRIPHASAVVVISDQLWREHFSSDPGILGRTVLLNGNTFQVIGVAPAKIPKPDILFGADVWIPMMMQDQAMPGQGYKLTRRGETWLSVIGRLRPGVTVGKARAEVQTLARDLEREYPKENRLLTATVVTEREGRDRGMPGVQRAAWVVLGMVGLVLLIACANIAGLTLVRSLSRRREFGIRLSLGASRSQLIRQVLTESLALSLIGGALSLAVAFAAAKVLLRFTDPIPIAITLDTGLDGRVLLFTLCVSLATGLLFGLLPALRSTRFDLTPSLKAGTVGLSVTRRRMNTRDILTSGQIAVSLVLLIVAGLFIRSLSKAQEIDLGFNPADRLVATIDTSLGGYSDAKNKQFWTALLERVRALQGVVRATTTEHAPLGPGYLGDLHVYLQGETPIPDERRPLVFFDRVGADYFKTIGTALRAGRDFTQQDQIGTQTVAVVNETFARTFWPKGDALGKRFRLSQNDPNWIEIVGVAPDGKYQTLGEGPQRHLFLIDHSYGPTLVVQTAANPAGYLGVIRTVVHQLDPNLPVTDLKTMTDHLGFALYPARVLASLLSVFGTGGMLLAMIGLYGLLALAVGSRTREVGIRMALGAPRRSVLLLIMRQGILLTAIGIGVGLIAAFGAARVVAGLLYGVDAHDLATFIVAPLSMAAVALLAMYIPVRRAAQVDPMTALRYE
jgi:predicted permease